MYVNSGGVYVLSFRCTLAWVALKLVNLCQITHFHVLAANIDIITFGFRVGLDFWKGVRQTEMVYVTFGGVYVLSFRCTLAWAALKLVNLCQITQFHVLAATINIITFGYRVGLDFWKGVRQTEMVYVNSGGGVRAKLSVYFGLGCLERGC